MTSDYFPTIIDLLDLELPARPYDGISLLPVIAGQMKERPRPIGFQWGAQASLTDNRFKLVHNVGGEKHKSDNGSVPTAEFELYDLIDDPYETENIADQHSDVVAEMKQSLQQWQASCRASARGRDYN